MPKYYVELENGVTIVDAPRKATARNYALNQFGRYHFKFVREATQEEIEWTLAMGGRIHKAEPVTS